MNLAEVLHGAYPDHYRTIHAAWAAADGALSGPECTTYGDAR